MRFGVYLERHAVPEWASRYVDYRRCSRLLAAAVASISVSVAAFAAAPPSADVNDGAPSPIACASAPAGEIASLDEFLSVLANEV